MYAHLLLTWKFGALFTIAFRITLKEVSQKNVSAADILATIWILKPALNLHFCYYNFQSRVSLIEKCKTEKMGSTHSGRKMSYEVWEEIQ